MASKRKTRWRTLRFRKNDPAHNVLAAVSAWIRANGGTAVVIGGVEIQDWDEGEFKYRIAVRVVGRKPQPEKGGK